MAKISNYKLTVCLPNDVKSGPKEGRMLRANTCLFEHGWILIFPTVNVTIQKGISSGSLIKDDNIQGGIVAAENYITSPWNINLVASDSRGGGTEVETKLALTISLDSAAHSLRECQKPSRERKQQHREYLT